MRPLSIEFESGRVELDFLVTTQSGEAIPLTRAFLTWPRNVAPFSPSGEKGHCIHSANSGHEAPSVNLSRPTWRYPVTETPFTILRHAPVLIAMSFQTQTGVVQRLLNHRNKLRWRISPSAVDAFIQVRHALFPTALWWL